VSARRLRTAGFPGHENHQGYRLGDAFPRNAAATFGWSRLVRERPEVANVDRTVRVLWRRLDFRDPEIPSMNELAFRKSERRSAVRDASQGTTQRQAFGPTRDVVNSPGPGRNRNRNEPAPGQLGFPSHTGAVSWPAGDRRRRHRSSFCGSAVRITSGGAVTPKGMGGFVRGASL
jgi:hypothetical protein